MNVDAIKIQRSAKILDAMSMLDKQASGILLLVQANGAFERTITDGDIRRLLLAGRMLDDTLETLPAMQSLIAEEGITRIAALALINSKKINHLPVLDATGKVISVLTRRELDEQIYLSSPHMGASEREYVDEAFRTNWIAPLGPNVDGFENELAAYVGVSHAAALSSGTAAIHLALCLLNVSAGDSVFCSTFTFVASVNPIIYQGAQPVFIDSEPESWNMSPVALEKALVWAQQQGKLPKAVIVVNLYGQSADMDPIVALCQQYGVPIVEDAAESLGAKYRGKASGTFGVMGIYSFNGNKIITTSGGGMLVSNDDELIKKARFLATQARDPAPHYEHTQIGYNYRMSNVLAGVGRGQLRVLDERVASRRAIYQRYVDKLGHMPHFEWMPEPEWSYSTHWLTACTVRSEYSPVTASELIQKLAADRIEARPVWKPMHLQPIFKHYPSFDHSDTSVATHLFEYGICLPSGSNMTEEQQDRVIDGIVNYAAK